MSNYSSQANPNPFQQQRSFPVGWIVFGVIAVIVVVLVFAAVNGMNRGNRYEQQLDAEWRNNQNVLSTYANKISEMAQVTGAYKKDLIELVKAEMQGRYGNQKNVLANWIKERDLNFDSSLYKNLQVTMDAGRDRFQNAQTKLLDIRREYKTALGNVPGGLFMIGYPKVDLSKYDPVISQGTKDTYDTGIDNAQKVFPEN